MNCRFLTLLSLFAFSFLTIPAQDGITSYTDRNSFSAGARDLKVNDFEGIVPNTGFKQYQREGSLHYAGIEFRPGGGARFGPGPVIVVGAWYQGGPAYETTSGAKLQWAPPNQPGNAYLEIYLPDGTTAIGTDIWTVQPLQSTVEVTVATKDGKSCTQSISTPPRPAAGFVGFTSETSIASIRITPPKGQTGLIIDNFTLGKSSTELTSPRSQNRPTVEAVGRPSGAITETPRPDERPSFENRSGKNSSSGVIAYVRNGTEIRLINADGSNDRQLWTHPDLNQQLGIFELAWKPDGTELAFSSAHEGSSSPYVADIYSIRPDGSGLHRLTNPPERAGLARFPKGSVTVNVVNNTPADQGPPSFIIYMEGAEDPQQVLIPSGASKTVTFKSVADFGRRPQMVIAMHGPMRWFVPGADVIPGRNVTAPTFPILDAGFEMHGAFRPVWRADGSRISYRNGGVCIISSSPAKPAAGTSGFNPIFSGKNPLGACSWDWGPTAATANQIIYSENSSGSNIYQMTEGGTHPGTKLTSYSDLDYQLLTDLHWIPDGSGLLYSTVNTFRDSSNIFRYDFASKKTTPVTKLDKEFAREFSISPDSTSVVFQRCKDREAEAGCDLWTIGIDGRGAKLLVKNGLRPAWGK